MLSRRYSHVGITVIEIGISLASLAIVLVVGTWLLGGFGARGEIAQENVIKRIDSLIGESKVKRKEIEYGIANGEKSLQPLSEGKIRAKVEADQLGRKIEEVQKKIGAAESSLKTLQSHLEKDGPVELAGTSYSQEELNRQARKVIEAHKTLTTELTAMKETRTKLLERADTFEKRHDEAKQQIARMKSQIRQVDLNIASLNSMKDARKAAGDGGITLAENFEKLESQINDLDAKTRTQVGIEDERWEEITAASEVDSVAQFIESTKGAEDTLSEISSILGGSE